MTSPPSMSKARQFGIVHPYEIEREKKRERERVDK
jgi:hypothetical protein